MKITVGNLVNEMAKTIHQRGMIRPMDFMWELTDDDRRPGIYEVDTRIRIDAKGKKGKLVKKKSVVCPNENFFSNNYVYNNIGCCNAPLSKCRKCSFYIKKSAEYKFPRCGLKLERYDNENK